MSGWKPVSARPRCAMCLRPVDRLEEEYDVHTDRIRFRVHCHGKTETVSIEGREARLIDPSAGVAFTDAPKLPEIVSREAMPPDVLGFIGADGRITATRFKA